MTKLEVEVAKRTARRDYIRLRGHNANSTEVLNEWRRLAARAIWTRYGVTLAEQGRSHAAQVG